MELVSFADRVGSIVGDDEGRLLLVLAHGANCEPAGSGNASNGRASGLRRPALTAAARSRGELLFRLIPKPYGNGRLEGIKSSGSIRALGRNANSRAMFDAQLQQGDEAFPIGDGITVTHFDVGLKALCQIDKGGGRTGMQSCLVEDHRIYEVRVISHIGAPGGRGRTLTRQGFDDVARVGRLGQAGHLLLVAQHTREPSQHLNVLVGFGRDPHDETCSFLGIPGHTCRHLHNGNTRLLDQVAVLGQAVGNRDAIAEIGVGHFFPAKHTGNVTCVDVPTVHKELTGLADGLLLIYRPGLQADETLINCDHNASKGFM